MKEQSAKNKDRGEKLEDSVSRQVNKSIDQQINRSTNQQILKRVSNTKLNLLVAPCKPPVCGYPPLPGRQ